jgi:hypothetical protein
MTSKIYYPSVDVKIERSDKAREERCRELGINNDPADLCKCRSRVARGAVFAAFSGCYFTLIGWRDRDTE